MKELIKKKWYIILIIILLTILIAISVVLYIKIDEFSIKEEKECEVCEPCEEVVCDEEILTNDSTELYDVSMFQQVSVEGAIGLFEHDGTSVLYIGRSDCGACQAFLPVLQEAQENLGYITYYLNLYDATYSVVSENTISKLLDKLTVTTTATVNGEEITGMYGDAFWGVTPMLIVIKDGKMVDGLLGAYDYDSLAEMLDSHGIGK